MLVPPSKAHKGEFLNIKAKPNKRQKNPAKSAAGSGVAVSDSNASKGTGGTHGTSNYRCSGVSGGDSATTNTEHSSDDESKNDSSTSAIVFHAGMVNGSGNHSGESSDECLSTDGEESDPNSPLCPDSQYLNQSTDLRAALIDSKALVGDYVELKNCKRCGSMIFKVSYSSNLSFLQNNIDLHFYY